MRYVKRSEATLSVINSICENQISVPASAMSAHAPSFEIMDLYYDYSPNFYKELNNML